MPFDFMTKAFLERDDPGSNDARCRRRWDLERRFGGGLFGRERPSVLRLMVVGRCDGRRMAGGGEVAAVDGAEL
jgi:hypothetical protein